ncbi:MAG: hypothetical protein ACOCUV_03165 [bacterium]
MKIDIKDFECPVCGSKNYDTIIENESIDVPFSGTHEFENLKLKCQDCETVTDYTKVFTEEYDNALEKIKQDSIEVMLGNLSNFGYSLAGIERALDLPQRTISRWRNNKEISSVGLALLRIINTYPWILNVAENKFDQNSARTIYIQNAISDFLKLYSTTGISHFSQFGTISNQVNMYIFAKYEYNDSDDQHISKFEELAPNSIKTITESENFMIETTSGE